MYALAVKKGLDKKLKTLRRKDTQLLATIENKVMEILEDPHRFKPLRRPLQNKRRVHIGGSFVLVYEIDKARNLVTLLDYDHHDNVCKT